MEDTEKKMVLNTARKQVEGAHANGIIQGTVDQNFPSTNPEWDPNQPGPRGMLTRSQKWILFGDRYAMPKAINRSKLYEVRQELNESPSAFMERLKVTARKYTNLDPKKPQTNQNQHQTKKKQPTNKTTNKKHHGRSYTIGL